MIAQIIARLAAMQDLWFVLSVCALAFALGAGFMWFSMSARWSRGINWQRAHERTYKKWGMTV